MCSLMSDRRSSNQNPLLPQRAQSTSGRTLLHSGSSSSRAQNSRERTPPPMLNSLILVSNAASSTMPGGLLPPPERSDPIVEMEPSLLTPPINDTHVDSTNLQHQQPPLLTEEDTAFFSNIDGLCNEFLPAVKTLQMIKEEFCSTAAPAAEDPKFDMFPSWVQDEIDARLKLYTKECDVFFSTLTHLKKDAAMYKSGVLPRSFLHKNGAQFKKETVDEFGKKQS